MAKFPKVVRPLVAMLCLAYCTPLPADSPASAKKLEAKKPEPGKFVRLQRDEQDQPVALETAIVHFVPASGDGGLQVDLVSAVHIGDQSYYEKLNQQFEKYDVVLYELVAPEGTKIPKGGKHTSDNPISLIQQMMKNVLGLESQVEKIDYTKKNFVHADLSPDEMAKAIHDRGDDQFTLFLGIAADLLRQQHLQELKKQKTPPKEEKEGAEPDLFSLLLDPEGSVKMKRMMAEQMADMETPGGGLGNTLGTILIADRNKAAIKVFQKELAKGTKKIAIFFGAGHMPDFQKRLQDDFGLKRDSEEWLAAWDMSG